MIRIATVFSGIGAPETALHEIDNEFQIVFACDNGERYLDIEPKEIKKIKKNNPGKTTQDIVKELYDNTGKPNKVKESYFANFNISEENWYEDIRFLDGKKYKGQVDIFVGGSPCQSFSTYGHRKGLEDARGTLFYDYARLVKEIHPKAFVFENVTGLLNHDGGKTWEVIQEVFSSIGYEIKMEILNAKDYNLPQLRRRVFVVGLNRKMNFPEYHFPGPEELTRKSSQYLDADVPNEYYLGEKGFNFVTKIERNQRRARVNQEIIGCQTANQQFNWIGDFRVEVPQKRHLDDNRIYKGLYNGELCVARKMTPRELLRLMGFNDFKIVVDDKAMWRQTGNSIAVPVMKAILEEIVKIIS